jgi:hypothetical protein
MMEYKTYLLQDKITPTVQTIRGFVNIRPTNIV